MDIEFEPALAELMDNQRHVLNAVAAPIVTISADGVIASANPSADLAFPVAPGIPRDTDATDYLTADALEQLSSVRRHLFVLAKYNELGIPPPPTIKVPSVQIEGGATIEVQPYPLRNPESGRIMGFNLALKDVSSERFEKFLNEISILAHSSLNTETVMIRIAEKIKNFALFDTLNIMLIKNGDGNQIEFSFTYGYDQLGIPAPTPTPETTIENMAGTLGIMKSTRAAMSIADTKDDPRWIPRELPTPDWGSYSAAPLVVLDAEGNKKVIGFLNLNALEYGAFQDINLNQLQRVADVIASAVENAQLYARDPNTGALNAGFFGYFLEKQMAHANRHNQELSLIAADIDWFKHFNDIYGHPAGDKLLKYLVMVLQLSLRNGDFVFRVGGEEFTILLPDTDIDGAMAKAENVRTIVERLMPHIIEKIKRGEDLTEAEISNLISRVTQDGTRVESLMGERHSGATLSLGVASRNAGIGSAKNLREEADKALYRAKRSGKNKVVSAQERHVSLRRRLTWFVKRHL
ncbi:GGDEF domain-containing protein [Candidatus Gottesmanbacteria bacterium]|nr:GGDEF domain-containing protein [Candidatus Gottesmanbacteria bacterium]